MNEKTTLIFDGVTYDAVKEFAAPMSTIKISTSGALLGSLVLDWRCNRVTANVINEAYSRLFSMLCVFIQDKMEFPFDPLHGFDEWSVETLTIAARGAA